MKTKKYVKTWALDELTPIVTSIDIMILLFEGIVDELKSMRENGAELTETAVEYDYDTVYAVFSTTDPFVADEYDFVEEDEYNDEDDEDDSSIIEIDIED